jgi:FtsP/CotA-like multicopper oxidase with cupredoxin domain
MRTNRILVACLSLALALALVPPALAGSAKRKVVGKVTAIGGSKNVKIRATPKGPGRAVKVGTKLTLGATIVMGKGARVTLRLKRPASVPKTRDLVYVKSARGTKHTSTLTRDAKGILVKIAPS